MKTILFFALVLWQSCAANAQTICQMNKDGTAPDVDAQGKQMCITIGPSVQESAGKFLATQTESSTDANGAAVITPKFASFWDFFARQFYAAVVIPILDNYPPASMATVKANADAAQKALQAAKLAAIKGQ